MSQSATRQPFHAAAFVYVLVCVFEMSAVKDVLIAFDFADINGGQAKVAIDSAKLLAERGVEVTFFSACGPVSPELERPGIKVVCLDQQDILNEPRRSVAMRRGIWNTTAAKALRDVAASLDPQTSVLHCHGYAKALSPAIGPVLTDGPLASVMTLHEYFLACPNGGFYDYQRQEICKRKPLGLDCLTTNCDQRSHLHKMWRVARQLATWGPGKMPSGLSDVITISKLQKEVMAPFFPDSTHFHYLPNPLPDITLPRVKSDDNDVFLFVGRMSPEKGTMLFAEAAKQLGARAVFAGSGPDADRIKAQHPDAELLGWQSPEQVQEWLSRARALVFPSVWYEGQPLVVVEALNRGVPVICGNWTASREFIEDGVNGVLLRTPSSVADLVEAMTQIAQVKPDKVRVPIDMSFDTHFAELMRIYDQMLERRSHQVA